MVFVSKFDNESRSLTQPFVSFVHIQYQSDGNLAYFYQWPLKRFVESCSNRFLMTPLCKQMQHHLKTDQNFYKQKMRADLVRGKFIKLRWTLIGFAKQSEENSLHDSTQ